MIAVTAVDYLAASVAVGFVVVGAGLVALGGLAARIDGTVRLGLQGFEFALRARQALDEAEREVEQRDPEEAKLLAEKVEELDDWFDEYQRVVAERSITNPYTRARLLEDWWRDKRQRGNPPPPESRN